MEKDLILAGNQQTANLISSIREGGAMGIIAAARRLMPEGNPDFSVIRQLPSIHQMKSDAAKFPEAAGYGEKNLHVLLMALVRNYCSAVNIPRDKNMTEDQIIEAAAFLLDECGNFRVEDYVMMFTLAKRGKLFNGKTGRVFDRVDLQLISEFKDNYEAIRWQYAQKAMEDEVKKKEFGVIEPESKFHPAQKVMIYMKRLWQYSRR